MNMRGVTGGARLRLRPSFSLRQLVRHAERGDGDTFAFLQYTTFIWFILLAGLIFAMLGFWRVGASYANNYGTRTGTLYTGVGLRNKAEGEARQLDLFSIFTKNPVPVGVTHFDPANNQRMATGWIHANGNELIPTYEINTVSQTRSERFFPGKSVCAAGETGCFE